MISCNVIPQVVCKMGKMNMLGMFKIANVTKQTTAAFTSNLTAHIFFRNLDII